MVATNRIKFKLVILLIFEEAIDDIIVLSFAFRNPHVLGHKVIVRLDLLSVLCGIVVLIFLLNWVLKRQLIKPKPVIFDFEHFLELVAHSIDFAFLGDCDGAPLVGFDRLNLILGVMERNLLFSQKLLGLLMITKMFELVDSQGVHLAGLQKQDHQVLAKVHTFDVQMVPVRLQNVARLQMVQVFVISSEVQGAKPIHVSKVVELFKLLIAHEVELGLVRGQGNHVVVVWIHRVVHVERLALGVHIH